ncbi:MAG TPA: RluA family pseudouridine synthase [Chitinophagaceae bacterium]|jgi:23S rRNA pseudouridine955/2504/2580 synthase/23S rRNA pseudouridine1911/1915/1917 synthase|nr:RluA family pseudouridine synthase [Chitinophagaceae bacterium]
MQLTKQILFEDEDFIVINKPAGLLSIPDRHNDKLASLSGLLEQRFGKIFIVHRLDKDTSGTIVFAKNEATHQFLSGQFQQQKTTKIYWGLATGRIFEKEGTIEAPIYESSVKRGKMLTGKKGKPARTTFEVLESFSLYTLLKLRIFTGRTHQIRVHLQSIGHPVAMDEVYGNGSPFYLSLIKRKYRIGKFQEEEKPLMSRMALHALSLSFDDKKGQRLTFEAPLPRDFQAVLHQLRKHALIQ